MGNAHHQLQLGGNDEAVVNLAAAAVGVGVAGAAGLGAALDARRPLRRPGEPPGRPPLWSALLLGASYAVLAPGLVCTLLSYNISVVPSASTVKPLRERTETLISFVTLMAESGCWPGVIVLVLYAMVIPMLKLVLLGLGERWRYSDSPRRLKQAGTCVRTVQAAAKWSCPDMFAWILLSYLVRGMGGDGQHLVSAARLDVGFTCFCAFCLGTTIGSLGIEPPSTDGDSAEEAGDAMLLLRGSGSSGSSGSGDSGGGEAAELEGRLPRYLPWFLTDMEAERRAKALAGAFAVSLCAGLLAPCMSLRLDLELLHIPPSLRPLVDSLHLPEAACADVSLWMCVRALFWSACSGEVNSAVAFVMIALFAVAASVGDVAVLTHLAVELPSGSSKQTDLPFRAARVLKRLAMLDVLMMGVFVVYLCMFSYRKSGVILSGGWGLVPLAAAELCHHLQQRCVSAQAATLRNC